MEDFKEYINQLRYDFTLETLDEKDTEESPFKQFEKWFKQAVDSKILDANAMNISSCINNKPSSRIVLLRGFNEDGLVFYTNYNSKKSKELIQNPHIAINFFWPELQRQIRIEGVCEKQNPAESDRYFEARPRKSKLGAWASPQSEEVENREVLEKLLEDFENKFKDKEVPRPDFWGGFVIKPSFFEFWQGREGRLHDRITYKLSDNNSWKRARIAP